MSAAPTPAALIACPKNLKPGFISSFPIQIDVLNQDTSRRIEDLVSPQCVRFKMTKSSAACNCADRSLPSHLTWVIHKPIDVGAAFFAQRNQKGFRFRQVFIREHLPISAGHA